MKTGAHMYRYKILMVLSLVFFNAVGQAAVKVETVNRISELSGLNSQIEQFPELVKSGMVQARQQGHSMPDPVFQNLMSSVNKSVKPDEIIAEVRSILLRSLEPQEAQKLLTDAKLLEKAGCFALVLEKVPAKLAQKVAESINIPVIGIGAGNGVDGQVLVLHDMLGMTHEFNPRFLRRYLNLYDEISGAVRNYVADVKSVDFPNNNEQY